MTFLQFIVLSAANLFIRLSFYPLRHFMKILVAGVQRIAGTAKASGSPFDMCNLLALTPIEIVNGKTQINGAGYKQMEIALDPAALPAFMNQKYPLVLDIETEPRPRMGKFETTVVGLVQPLAKAA